MTLSLVGPLKFLFLFLFLYDLKNRQHNVKKKKSNILYVLTTPTIKVVYYVNFLIITYFQSKSA